MSEGKTKCVETIEPAKSGTLNPNWEYDVDRSGWNEVDFAIMKRNGSSWELDRVMCDPEADAESDDTLVLVWKRRAGRINRKDGN